MLGTLHARGWLPTLATLTTSPALLAELVRELTGETMSCEALYHQHRGNLRAALRELYDRAAA